MNTRLVRTDAGETEIDADAAFTTGYSYSSTVDMRDHTELAVWVEVTAALGGVNQVEIIAEAAPTSTALEAASQENEIKSDDTIASGAFVAAPYVMTISTAAGTLVQGYNGPFVVPRKGRYMRVGVKANSAASQYRVKSQRLA